MRFETEAERLAHPQARLIPHGLWENRAFFDRSLSGELLSIMQASDSELTLLAEQTFHKFQEPREKQCAWFAIALSKPNQSPEVLRNFGRQLSISDKNLLQLAATINHLAVLHYLEEIVPDGLCKMIKADEYYAFRLAARYGHLSVLQYLAKIASDNGFLYSMMTNSNYYAFCIAAENGHLNVLHYLEEIVPDELCKMIEIGNYYAYRYAAKNGHHEVIQYLLSQVTCFTYAERHMQEYGCFVNPFIIEKINALRAQKDKFNEVNLHAVFDIGIVKTCKFLFYVLRNLIRRNEVALQDDILFLLNIPSVKALVHSEVTPYVPNELLRLAFTIGNQGATSLLLKIPAVRELAQQNKDFQQILNFAQLNPQDFFEDTVSRNTAGSPGENGFFAPQSERLAQHGRMEADLPKPSQLI